MVQILNYSLLTLLLLTQVSSFVQPVQPPSSSEESLFEDKVRLGSTPPSCHNRCSGCHPCMAIQVPTLPSHDRVTAVFGTSPDAGVSQFSNYKPMGWKCHCNGHFFNP